MAADRDVPKWFVLKAGRKERTAETELTAAGFETYLPLQRMAVERCGKKVMTTRPLIGNMIFVRSTHQRIDAYVKSKDYLHFAYRREGERFLIMEVPDEEMLRFRHTAEAMTDDLRYYPPEAISLRQGMRVRITGGALDGMECTILEDKAEGHRTLVVDFCILGTLSTHVIPEYVQILQE